MVAIFLAPFIAPASARAGAVVDATAVKPATLIPASTVRREALAALNDVSLDGGIAVSRPTLVDDELLGLGADCHKFMTCAY
jgi:hypothetical protein